MYIAVFISTVRQRFVCVCKPRVFMRLVTNQLNVCDDLYSIHDRCLLLDLCAIVIM